MCVTCAVRVASERRLGHATDSTTATPAADSRPCRGPTRGALFTPPRSASGLKPRAPSPLPKEGAEGSSPPTHPPQLESSLFVTGLPRTVRTL